MALKTKRIGLSQKNRKQVLIMAGQTGLEEGDIVEHAINFLYNIVPKDRDAVYDLSTITETIYAKVSADQDKSHESC